LNITTCSLQEINATNVTNQLQKNEGTIQLLSPNEITELFAVKLAKGCDITKYEVVDENKSTIPSGSTLFDQLNLASFASSGSLMVDSATTDIKQLISFYIKASISSGLSGYSQVNVSLGCIYDSNISV